MFSKTWGRAEFPSHFPKDFRKGKTTGWVYVDNRIDGCDAYEIYISNEIFRTKDPDVLASILLSVQQNHTTFYIDPSKKVFKTVACTPMTGIPVKEAVERDMKEGDIASTALNFILANLYFSQS